MAREDLIWWRSAPATTSTKTCSGDSHKQYPQKFAVKVEFDNPLAHKIEAGADMFLMPSKYEPAGLNQIYSLKYGTVPIVRATGGLDDTIEPWDAKTQKEPDSNSRNTPARLFWKRLKPGRPLLS